MGEFIAVPQRLRPTLAFNPLGQMAFVRHVRARAHTASRLVFTSYTFTYCIIMPVIFQVQVRVDEAWGHEGAIQVEVLRAGQADGVDVVVAAHGDDAVVCNGDGTPRVAAPGSRYRYWRW